MSPVKREFILYLEDMLQSMNRIDPEIPWRKMYGLRNLIAHEYFGIDYEMIWEIAKNNLPGNRIDLQKIINKEKAPNGNNVQK